MREVFIGGKHRPINFGVSAISMYCGMKKIPMTQMEGAFNDMTLEDATDLIYCALLAGHRRAKVAVDFTHDDVLDWIDDTEAFTQAMEAFNESQQADGLKKKELPKAKVGRKA